MNDHDETRERIMKMPPLTDEQRAEYVRLRKESKEASEREHQEPESSSDD